MIEPFAPLYPWLRDALDDAQLVLAIAEPDEDDPRPALDARDVGDHLLALSHGPTRYAVLRAIADAGHARPWAIGAPWSPLTDEQAGRATAAILRAVGEDPSKPAGVVPVCVLTALRLIRGAVNGCKESGAVKGCYSTRGVPGFEYHPKFNQIRLCNIGTQTFMPAETEDAAVKTVRSLGCLMIEDLTP